MKVLSLFPTHVAMGKIQSASQINRQILKEVSRLSSEDHMGRDWSKENYRGGYTSYASLNNLHYRSPVFMEFASLLDGHANSFAKKLKWNMRGLRLEMTDLWMNVMPEGTYHPLHLHPHSVLSGAYYVSVPTDSVSLKIEDPKMPYLMNAPAREMYHRIEPEAGSFVMFESWVRHEVPPNRSKKPRISLSFNYAINEDDY